MKTRDEIKEILSEEMIEITGCYFEEITEDANLENDLGFDSLDAVELEMAMERRFNIRLDESIENLKGYTVSNVLDFLQERIK